MRKLTLVFVIASLLPIATYAKSQSMNCTPALRNLGACTQAQAGDPGALIYYWLPQQRALNVRDVFVERFAYQAEILCTNMPSPGDPDNEPVIPWDATVAYVEKGHCLQSEAGNLVPNPIGINQWVDFQIRLHVRKILRNHRIRSAVAAVAEPVRDAEESAPVEPFEDEPDDTTDFTP